MNELFIRPTRRGFGVYETIDEYHACLRFESENREDCEAFIHESCEVKEYGEND